MTARATAPVAVARGHRGPAAERPRALPAHARAATRSRAPGARRAPCSSAWSACEPSRPTRRCRRRARGGGRMGVNDGGTVLELTARARARAPTTSAPAAGRRRARGGRRPSIYARQAPIVSEAVERCGAAARRRRRWPSTYVSPEKEPGPNALTGRDVSALLSRFSPSKDGQVAEHVDLEVVEALRSSARGRTPSTASASARERVRADEAEDGRALRPPARPRRSRREALTRARRARGGSSATWSPNALEAVGGVEQPRREERRRA